MLLFFAWVVFASVSLARGRKAAAGAVAAQHA
jgi:hypothetical protein